MSDFPPGSSANSSAASTAKSPAFAEALQKARQLASKLKPDSANSTSSLPLGTKRPLDDPYGDGPDSKKSAAINDPFGAQLAARAGMEDIGAANGAGAVPAGDVSSCEIMVPDKMVGLIIGRGGEQITRLQAESGCKIQMAPDNMGLPERKCTLTGSASAIQDARSSIERIISNEGNGPPRGQFGGGGGGGPGSGPTGAGGAMFEMMVPGHKVGLIIGKGGETIKQLQEQSGAKIVIIQDTPEAAQEKPLRITGTPEGVEQAKQLVIDILNQNDDRDMGGFGGRGRGRGRGRGGFDMRGGGRGGGRGGRGGFGGGPGGPGHWGGPGAGGPGGNDYGGQSVDYVAIPSNKCGLIIGKGGETIKNINQTSGAHCEVDRNAPPDARDKNFVIKGSPEAVERAKAMIMEKLGQQGNGGGYGGGGGGYGGGGGSGQQGSWGGHYDQGGYQQQPAAQPAAGAGGADYSQQWAEYYRSVGMHKEAEAIEARNRAGSAAPGVPQANGAPSNGAPVAAAAPGGAPAGAGGADYSAQWAEYYRSVGKIKEAEAIEAQIKPKPGAAPGQPYAAQPGQYPGYYGQSPAGGAPAAAAPQPGSGGYAAAGYPAAGGYSYGQPE